MAVELAAQAAGSQKIRLLEQDAAEPYRSIMNARLRDRWRDVFFFITVTFSRCSHEKFLKAG